jgi:hypothetical protein
VYGYSSPIEVAAPAKKISARMMITVTCEYKGIINLSHPYLFSCPHRTRSRKECSFKISCFFYIRN